MAEVNKDNRKIVALLTGRGGSALKDKNVMQICGHPLLYYPASAARNSKYINEFYVSSDDQKILDTAGQLGYKKIVRPDELSKPDSQHADVILHALKVMKLDGIEPGILIVLLANAVTIKAEWIDECIDLLMRNEAISAVIPVSLDSDHHPYRAKKVNREGLLEPFFDFKTEKISTNRQDLEPSYFLCHNFWALRVSNSIYSQKGQPPWTFMGSKIIPYIIDDAIDVHNLEDVKMAEAWVGKNLK